jgi:TIGR03009 family protein
VLTEWERRSDKIARFKCDFQRWDYDPQAGPTAVPQGRSELKGLKARGSGEIKYKAPDNGTFKLDKYEQYIPQKDATTLKYEDNPTAREHWVCDGQAIYQFRPKEKQLIETRLPPELQGKAISDGPLPFIFGAKAETLKKRYWLRITTPEEQAKTEIWLEAYPKFQQDAANFAKVDLILGRDKFLPVAMQIHTPGKPGVRTVYRFGEASVNDLLSKFNGEFASPTKPFGWQRIIEHAPSADTPPAKNVQSKQQPADETARRGMLKTK